MGIKRAVIKKLQKLLINMQSKSRRCYSHFYDFKNAIQHKRRWHRSKAQGWFEFSADAGGVQMRGKSGST
jgi:hypothetical protein